MILETRDKRVISDTRMEKAREFLLDARATFEERRYRTSVNRAYYAALNAVRAILILEGANPETHDGAVTLLSLRFVKTEDSLRNAEEVIEIIDRARQRIIEDLDRPS